MVGTCGTCEQKNNINDCFRRGMDGGRSKKLKMFDDIRGGYKRTNDNVGLEQEHRRQQWCIGSCTEPGHWQNTI